MHAGTQPFKQAVDEAIQNGWTIEQVVCNSETNAWLAVLGKYEEIQ